MLGIILVVHTSVGGDKLVFRYPTVSRNRVSDETLSDFKQQHPLTTLNPNQPTFTKGSTNLDSTENNQQDQSTNSGNSSKDKNIIYNLPSVVITPILTPKQRLCDQSFELTIENTTFIGHPTNLTNNEDEDDKDNKDNSSSSNKKNKENKDNIKDNKEEEGEKNINEEELGIDKERESVISNITISSSSSSSSSSSKSKQTCEDRPKENQNQKKDHHHEEITLFNIVFVLSTQDREINKKKLDSFKRISMQLSSALKHEQIRCDYITKQVHDMLVLREKWLTEQTLENSDIKPPNHHILTERMIEKSKLARELRDIYHGLNENEIVNLRINGWINLHLNLNNPDIYPLYPIRPYHALLAFTSDTGTPKLPIYDTSPALIKLLEVSKPTKNFRDLQLETDIPITQIYRLASHLVYWKKAKIINMMTRNNYYILRPSNDSQEYNYIELEKKFTSQFPDFKLYEILMRFSNARPLSEHMQKILPSYHAQFLGIVGWLLQHDLIVQLFTYVHLMIHTIGNGGLPNNPNSSGGITPNSGNNSNNNNNAIGSTNTNSTMSTSNNSTSLIYQPTTFPLMPSHLSSKEQAFFDNIDDNSNSYQLFKRLCVYFRGLHHLEEIMWRENITREQLTKILKRYKSVLIQVFHEGDDIINSSN